MTNPIQHKQCRICNEAKPLTAFHRSADRRDGHKESCAICLNAKRLKRNKLSRRQQNNDAPLLPGEEWRAVVGFEGIYSVSSLGRVRRDSPGRATFPGKILKPGNSGGYRSVALWKNRAVRSYHVHCLMARAFFKPDPNPDRTDVNHKDGDRSNNALSNLEWCTHQENVTHSRVVLKKNAKKLTEEDVRQIRARFAAGESVKILATDFGIEPSTVRANVRRRWWKHLE